VGTADEAAVDAFVDRLEEARERLGANAEESVGTCTRLYGRTSTVPGVVPGVGRRT
jgi:hypothetical protein